MNVGDLFWTFRGDGARLQKDAKVEGAKAGETAGKSFTDSMKKAWSGGELGKGLVQGLGLAGGLGAARLASDAVSGLVNVLQDAVQAAIEDEASQQKLGTALKANIPAWDGNTAAIESVLKARMDLGFSDDEQRQSLALLVAATHDVTKALEIQRTAMDLARLKGISLADASDALVKVEAGQYRALKSLGIVLKAGATQQDALNAVQKVATGQAEDYAKTTGGKMLVAQTKINEALENLGYTLLPIVADAATLAAETVDNITSAFDGLNDALKQIPGSSGNPLSDLGQGIDAVIGTMSHWGSTAAWLQEKVEKQNEATLKAAEGVETLRETTKGTALVVASSYGDMSEAGRGFASETKTATGQAADYFGALTKSMEDDLTAMISGFFDPLETRYSILEAHRQLAADKEALRTAKTATAIHDATAAIETDLKKQADGLADLQSQGNLTKQDVAKFTKDATAAYKAMGKAVPPEIQAIIDQMNVLAGIDGVSVKVNIATRKAVPGHVAGKRAGGGPVAAGVPYVVGEHRPEVFVPQTNGVVVPSVGAFMAGAGAGGGMNINLTVPAAPTALKPTDIVRELRIRAGQGFFAPRRR